MQNALFMHEMPNKTVMEGPRLRESSDAMSCAKEGNPVLLLIFLSELHKKINKPSENSDGTFKRGNKKFVFTPEYKGKSQALNIVPVV